jgi:hypothetical protein
MLSILHHDAKLIYAVQGVSQLATHLLDISQKRSGRQREEWAHPKCGNLKMSANEPLQL